MRPIRIAVAALLLSSAAAAQPRIEDAAALKRQADALRQVWKLQPGKPVTMTIPLYGRVMRIDMPVGFVPAYKVEGQGQFLFEFTEGDETVHNWKRLITIRSMAGAGASTFDTAFIAEGMFRPTACYGEPLYRVMEEKDLGGGLSSIALATGCGNVAGGRDGGEARGIGEIGFIRMVRDTQSVYSYAIALRRKEFQAASPPLTDAEGLAMLETFGKVLLCKRGDADKECRAALAMDRLRAGQ
jgi:hypothetical protein